MPRNSIAIFYSTEQVKPFTTLLTKLEIQSTFYKSVYA